MAEGINKAACGLLLASLITGACSPDQPGDGVDAQNIASPAIAPAPAAHPAGQSHLAGSGQGLRFGKTEARLGAPIKDALKVAEAAGVTIGPSQLLEECGAGPLTSYRAGNLSLLGQDGKFAGWHISEPGPLALRTDRSVTIGTARSRLESAHQTQIFESSVGTEFSSEDGLGGLLSNSSPSSRVTHLWAGTTCIMR